MRALGVVLTLFCVAGDVYAQDGHPHQGFWIGFGVGGGVNASKGLDGEALGGGAAYLRLGGTPSQKVLLGFEGIGWGREQGDVTLARGNGTFTVLVFPSRTSGAFLKAGVGGASVSREETQGNTTTTTTEAGFGSTLGIGLDVRLGRNIYLTPNVDWVFQAFDAGEDPILGAIPGTNSIALFTLGLTWH